jgi:hypothetical protein
VILDPETLEIDHKATDKLRKEMGKPRDSTPPTINRIIG